LGRFHILRFLGFEESNEILVTVPHLIVIVKTESGLAVQTKDLKYGLRVNVLVFPDPQELMRPEALKVVGPKAFGYDVEIKC
jgi:DUF917 family protein